MLFLSTVLVINISFIYLYFILSFLDLFAGIYVNVFVGKQKFESSKFLKNAINRYGNTYVRSYSCAFQHILFYEDRENAVLRGLLDGIVFLFEGVKITMIIFFVIYELYL